jgi:NADPH2:quinone reductase
MDVMKAIRVRAFGEPEVLQLANLPDPTPGHGQVLIRVAAAGVNPVETYVRSGKYPRLPELPYTPGTDGAGIIFRTGQGVPSHLREGQRVWLSGSLTGTYADAALCEVAHVHPLPDRVSFAQGAALGIPYATAYRALFQRGKAHPGETVLIHGATGGAGFAAVQFARMFGLEVLGTGGTAEGRKLIEEHGARTFDHSAPDYREQILGHTAGRGVHLIIEMLANINLGADLTLLAPRGRVAVMGSRGPVEINPRDAMMREADIRGVILAGATPAEFAEAWAAIDRGLETGLLAPAIAEEVPLPEAPRAHELVMAPGHRGKIVLRCADL